MRTFFFCRPPPLLYVDVEKERLGHAALVPIFCFRIPLEGWGHKHSPAIEVACAPALMAGRCASSRFRSDDARSKHIVPTFRFRCMENKKFNGTKRARTLTFYLQTLKGGDGKMADEFNNKDTATLCPTKAGNGFKVVVDGTWFYTSKASLLDMVNGKNKACTFSTIKDDKAVAK